MSDPAFAFCMGICFGIVVTLAAVAVFVAWFFGIGRFA
jgi:hypothetical protein